jgi:hypothetical protein
MAVFGSVWRACFCVVSTVGILCTYAEWGWSGLAMSAFTVAVFAAAIGASVWAGYGLASAGRVVRLIATSGWVVTSATGLIAVFHVAGGCVALLLAVTTPGLASLLRRSGRPAKPQDAKPSSTWSDHPPSRDVAVSDSTTLVMPQDVSALDDEALCLAWRRSFFVLSRARSAMESLSVVEQRTRILDELHRRSPEGLAAWWASGGRASGNPLRYLGEHRSKTDPGGA